MSNATSNTTSKKPTASGKVSAQKVEKEYGLVIGMLEGFADDSTPLVAFNNQPAIQARTLIDIGEEHIGKSVALQFERGELHSPLVMGIVKTGGADSGADLNSNQELPSVIIGGVPMQAKLDDDDIVLIAQRRITLQCGSASISLDAQGNIELRGKYIVSRASGQNRLKGSSVSLN
ncbi:hypothetical protein AAKU61_002930 [Undibacterium sp. GrIS 1.2]|uniref:DUF6484 domain-containing protein n=1 Tax=Undibacterium sp. GrIS 1.2 TaxID=3143933 RepID=UPI00339682F5